MRTLRKNRQKMYYSLDNVTKPSYQFDDDENISYVEVDGIMVPVATGGYITTFSEPQLFYANISSNLSETHMMSYGIDQSNGYCEIIADKGKLPLEIGSIIWKESKIAYSDLEKTIPKKSSCDYIVKGIMTEGLNEDCFLLQRNSKEEK